MLFLIGCVPDVLTIYPVGDGTYGVEPSGICCLCVVLAVVFLAILHFAHALSNR